MQGIQGISPQTVHIVKSADAPVPAANEPKAILIDQPDTVELSRKAVKPIESKTGKKWGVGVASFILPGLGQACNGQWGKGCLHFGLQAGLTGLAWLMAFSCPPLAVLASLGVIATRVVSIVDAVKNV